MTLIIATSWKWSCGKHDEPATWFDVAAFPIAGVEGIKWADGFKLLVLAAQFGLFGASAETLLDLVDIQPAVLSNVAD